MSATKTATKNDETATEATETKVEQTSEAKTETTANVEGKSEMKTEAKPIKLNPEKKKDLKQIDPRSVIFDKDNNPRQFYGTEQEWKELKQSISTNGVEVPIKVKKVKDGYKLIHGYRRMTAVMELIEEGVDIKYIKAEAAPRSYNEEKELIDHLTLNSGLPLTPMEEANVYERLQKHGWTQKDIATQVGKTQGAISNTLKLSNLSKRVQNFINERLVSATLVMRLIKEHGGDYKKVEAVITAEVARLDVTKKKKVTEKTVAVKRVSPYHKRFSGSIKILEERKVSESKISKVKSIMEALDSKDSEELADKLLAIL